MRLEPLILLGGLGVAAYFLLTREGGVSPVSTESISSSPVVVVTPPAQTYTSYDIEVGAPGFPESTPIPLGDNGAEAVAAPALSSPKTSSGSGGKKTTISKPKITGPGVKTTTQIAKETTAAIESQLKKTGNPLVDALRGFKL